MMVMITMMMMMMMIMIVSYDDDDDIYDDDNDNDANEDDENHGDNDDNGYDEINTMSLTQTTKVIKIMMMDDHRSSQIHTCWNRFSVDLICPTGVVPIALDGQRHVNVSRIGKRFAIVQCLEFLQARKGFN